MLIGLATGLRFRLGLAFAAFAALCFVAPPAVLAFGHGGNTLDCVAHADRVNHGKAGAASDATHAHSDHAPSAHHPPQADHEGPAADQEMTCCGLFCLSALAADAAFLDPAATIAAPYPAQQPGPPARLTERLDRPPISLVVV
jgi:hypothetical protein